jgi:hypothetical protein
MESTRRYSYFGIDGIGGGLVSENPIVLAKNQMVIADNLLMGTTISRKKRGGQVPYNTGCYASTPSYPASGVPIRGILDFWRTASLAGNPIDSIFLHQGTQVWNIPGRSSPAVDVTGALVLSPNGVPSYQMFNQFLYFCSTITADGYNVWDGTSSTARAANPPPDGVGKYLCSHLGRMVMAGNDDFPFRVYLSTEFNPENWDNIPPDNGTSLDLDADGDPEGITGIASFQGQLYIWTRKSLYTLTGNDPTTFDLYPVSRGIGAISNASIVQVPNDVIFPSERGVHSLRQMNASRLTESTFLSRDIQKLWTTLINPSIFKQITAVFFPNVNCYMISVPSSGQETNDTLLVYNIEYGTWTNWTGIEARSIATLYLNNQLNIMTGREDGTIALLNQNTQSDLGNAGFTARMLTGVLYPGTMDKQKRFKSITVLAATLVPSQFTVGWVIDGTKYGSKPINLTQGQDLLGTTFVLGKSVLGVGQFVPTTVSIDDIGYGIQVDLISGGNSDIEIYGFILEVEDANPNYT